MHVQRKINKKKDLKYVEGIKRVRLKYVNGSSKNSVFEFRLYFKSQ